MKILISYLLTSMITLASFQNLFFLVDYHFNQDDYESLCVNKDKPEMHCNGKCELRKESETSSKTKKSFNIGFVFTATSQNDTKFIFKTPNFFEQKKRFFSNWKINLEMGYFSLKPHPPQLFI
jgi:hypothetical protein